MLARALQEGSVKRWSDLWRFNYRNLLFLWVSSVSFELWEFVFVLLIPRLLTVFTRPVGAASEDPSGYATKTLAECFVTVKVL